VCAMISQECPSLLGGTQKLRGVEGGTSMVDNEDSTEERVVGRATD
jgi:hypothetical protein